MRLNDLPALWVDEIDPSEDTLDEIKISKIQAVHIDPQDGTRFSIVTRAGWTIRPSNPDGLPVPTSGQTAYCFTKGTASAPVRGFGTETALFFYESVADYEASRLAEMEAAQAAAKALWDEGLDTFAGELLKLPEAFRARIEAFMEKPGWGPICGAYELFVCQQAMQVVDAAPDVEDKVPWILAFATADADVQKMRVSGLTNYNPDVIEKTCQLAKVYLDKPEDLLRVHGAACSHVGCEAAHCWAIREA